MGDGKFTGYCMKCKKSQDMDPSTTQIYKMGPKKDRSAVRGKCTKCSTNMNKILSAADKARLGIK